MKDEELYFPLNPVSTVSLTILPDSDESNRARLTVIEAVSGSYTGDRTARITASITSATSLTVTTGSGTTSTITIQNLGNPSAATLTVEDDSNLPGVTAQPSAKRINEGDTMTGTVELTGAVGFPTKVFLYADSDSLYEINSPGIGLFIRDGTPSKVVEIPAGDTSASFTITAIDDDVDAGESTASLKVVTTRSCKTFPSQTDTGECLPVELAVLPPNNSAFTSLQTFVIVDNDDSPTVTLQATPSSLDEGEQSKVNARLSHPSIAATTIQVRETLVTPDASDPRQDSIVAFEDQVSLVEGVRLFNLVVAAGLTVSTRPLTIVSADNDYYAGDRSIEFEITSATNTVGITPPAAGNSLTVAIKEDETAPTYSLVLGKSEINESGAGNETTVKATISTPISKETVVSLEHPGTDDDPAAYELSDANASLTIAAKGTESRSLTITAIDNSLSHPNLTVKIQGVTGSGDQIESSNLTITDDDETHVTLILSRTEVDGQIGISELEADDQAANFFTISAVVDETSARSSGNIEIEVSITPISPALESDYVLSDRTLTIEAGTDVSNGTLTVTAVDNDIDGPDKALEITGTVTLGSVSQLTIPSGAVMIIDDERQPVVTLRRTDSESASLEEGGTAEVIARLQHPSSEPTEVTLEVTSESMSDITVRSNPILTIQPGEMESSEALTITTVDNDAYSGGPSRREVKITPVAVTDNVFSEEDLTEGELEELTGRSFLHALSLYILDNDVVPMVSLKIEPTLELVENDETVLVVRAVMDTRSTAPTEVEIMVDQVDSTATENDDFILSGDRIQSIAPGATESEGTLTITVVDDREFDPDEFIKLTYAASNAVGINNVASQSYTVEIVDDDRQVGDGDRHKHWLSRFGRTAAGHVVEAINKRFDAVPEGDSQWTLGSMADLDRKVIPSGSSFVLPLAADGAGGNKAWTIWGRTAYSEFEGREGLLKSDGEVLSGTLGIDYLGDRTLAGLAASYSEADGWVDRTGEREAIRSDHDTSLTSVHPYLRVSLAERTSVWGLLGYGRGNYQSMVENEEEIDTDIEMYMGALGLYSQVASLESFDLAVKSDVLVVQMDWDGRERLAKGDADVSRVRVLLEGTGEHRILASGGTLEPKLEAGLRYDEGEAETGVGVELGAGVRYTSPGGRLAAEASARALVLHEESDFEEIGVGGSVHLVPDTAGRGLSLHLDSSYGVMSSSTEQLWSRQDMAGFATYRQTDLSGRYDVELAYGMNALQGRGLLIPYIGFGQADGERTWRFGYRMEVGPSLSLKLQGQSDLDGVGIAGTSTFRW